MKISSNQIYQKIDLSIIIPMYNVEDYIVATLDSMKAITTKNIELLLIDDGSTDDTLELVNSWLLSNNVDYTLFRQENGGPSKARNLGIHEARGNLITFFDSDDLALSYVYQNIIDVMTMYDVDFSIVRGMSFDHVTQNVHEFPDYYVWDKIMGNESFKILTTSQEPRIARLEPSSVVRVYRKDFILGNNILFPEGCFFEDVSFHVECVSKVKKVALINKTLLMYRTNREGQTTSSFGKKRNDMLKILSLIIDQYRYKLVTDEVWANFVGLLVRMTVWCSENCEYQEKKQFVDQSVKLFQKLPKDLFKLYSEQYAYNQWEYSLCKAYLGRNMKVLYKAAEGGYPDDGSLHVNQVVDIYSVHSKVEQLLSQQKDGWAHDRFVALNDKIEQLLSQQKDGWAHDRFVVLNDKIHQLLDQQHENLLRDQQREKSINDQLYRLNDKIENLLSHQVENWVGDRLNILKHRTKQFFSKNN